MLEAFQKKRRWLRRRVLKDGRVILPGSQVTYDCSIRDLSETGIKIRLPGNTIELPERFELVFVTESTAYPVSVRWRKNNDYGVEITGQARLVTARIN